MSNPPPPRGELNQSRQVLYYMVMARWKNGYYADIEFLLVGGNLMLVYPSPIKTTDSKP